MKQLPFGKNFRTFIATIAVLASAFCEGQQPLLRMPFPNSATAYCSQGNNDTPSHNANSTKWDVDIVGSNLTVVAAAPGTAYFRTGENGGWGNNIRIDHGNGLYTLYAHLKDNSILISNGQQVQAGQALATMGKTGNATGVHLHFGIHSGDANGSSIGPSVETGSIVWTKDITKNDGYRWFSLKEFVYTHTYGCSDAPIAPDPPNLGDPAHESRWSRTEGGRTFVLSASQNGGTQPDQYQFILRDGSNAAEIARSPWINGTTAATWTVGPLGSGSYWWTARAVRSGNISAESPYPRRFWVNEVPAHPGTNGPKGNPWLRTLDPVLSWNDPGDPDNWPNNNRDYLVSVRRSGDGWETHVGWQYLPTTWSPHLPGDGQYSWKVNSGDGADDNGYGPEESFRVDTVSPIVTFVSVTPPSPGDAGQVDITIDRSDPGGSAASGVQSVVLTVDGGAPLGESGGSYHWDASSAADGAHTILATVTDNAGNTGTATWTYAVDRTAPTVNLVLGPVIPNGLNGWYISAPMVTLTSSGTGTPVIHYRLNGGADTVYGGPFTLEGRGKVAVEYWAVSSAGRKGPVGTATVKVDTTSPAGFSLTDEGAVTPSRSLLNVVFDGTIDNESGYDLIEYKVGNAAGDDRYWRSNGSTVPAWGPWLTADGLFLPFNSPVVVTLRVRNVAGLWSGWVSTDGIAVDQTGWLHAVWNSVIGASGGFSSTTDGAHQGTLGEGIVGGSSATDVLWDAGFWALFTSPKLTVGLTLGNYAAAAPAAPVTIELRLPGTTTVVETHNLYAKANGTLSVYLGRTGTYDIAIKGSHWLRQVVRNVAITDLGAVLSSVVLVNGDVDGNNVVNATDRARVTIALGAVLGGPGYLLNADLDGNGVINATDRAIVTSLLGRVGTP